MEKKKRISAVTLTACLLVGLTAVSAVAHASQVYSWRNVQIAGGGFTPGIIYNQTEPNLVYIRTDIGGAYRRNPCTNRWIPLLDWVGWDEWNLTGVESIATDTLEPNRLYIAAGTYTNEWTDMNGAILRSADYGKTFDRTDLPFKLGGNMPGRSMGERLAIDPHKNSIIYFGARSGNGLWRSTDYGVTWSQVTSFTAVGNYAPGAGSYDGDLIGVVWVTFDPGTGTPGNTTQTIYVGVADTNTSIYRSTDGGVTWAPVPGQPTDGFLPHHGVLASNGVLYITYSNHCGPYQGSKGDVWKYNASTGLWTRISPIPSSSGDNNFGYGGLTIDAQHPDTIVVSSLELWWPDDIIFRSTDGGATWKRIWEWAGYPNRTFYYTHDISDAPWLDWGRGDSLPEVSPKLGWMIGDIEIDPFNSDKMMYVTGATVYGSDNLTDWDTGGTVNITVKAQGEEETAVLDLISPPAGAHLISALGDLGGFRHNDLTVVPASMLLPPSFGSGTGLDYAELDPNVIVRVGNGDGIINYSYSNDGGLNWTEGITEPNGVYGGGTVAVAADGSRVVWAPGGAAVSYSTSLSGTTWNASADIPAQAQVASDRVNPNKFYGFSSGTFYVSTDGGANFTAMPASVIPLPSAGSVRFKAMPGIEGDIWLVGGTESDVYGIWHSTDSGASFSKLVYIQKADTIGFGKAAPGRSYMTLYSSAQINGVRGIFRSTDAGVTWVRINDDRHQYAWTGSCITGDPRIYGRVYISTNGRGIVYGDVYGDFTDDGIVDMNDLAEFCENLWLEDGCDETIELDLNSDCIINFYEFSTFAQNWLEGI